MYLENCNVTRHGFSTHILNTIKACNRFVSVMYVKTSFGSLKTT